MENPCFWVAPDGDDLAPGDALRPFASLVRARDAVRELKGRVRGGDITVLIRGGTYLLAETVRFGLEDSAPPGGRIVYAAAPGETPVFSSGVRVSGWRRLPASRAPAEAPEAARGRLWVASFPPSVERVTALFDGSRRLKRATEEPFAIPVAREDVAGRKPRELAFPPGTMRRYANLESVELSIIPMHPWTMNILGLESVDPERCVALLDNDPVYPLARTHHGLRDQVWVENVFTALRGPGTWVSDNRERMLYLWPEGEEPTDGIVVPRLRELVRIGGRIEAAEDVPVRGIVLRGLTFTHGARDTWDQDYQGTGLQHNWEFFDRANAMVRLRGAEECAVEDCRLVDSASGAIRLDLSSSRNRVSGCEIAHVGGTGVLLQGYGPGTRDTNRENVVEHNHIHHVGEDWWHSLAVFVWQSSRNRIAHNTIHHCPYSGICVTGRVIFDRSGAGEASRSVRWDEIVEDTAMGGTPEDVTRWWYRMERYLHARHNIIEKNEIFRVMERLGDGNGIYISGCGRGNVVRLNYIHDVFGAGSNAMIRTDDLQYETLIEKNLISRCGGPGVYLKHRNDFVNNVLVDLGVDDPAGAYSGKPAFSGYIGLRRAPIHGSRVERNLLWSTKGGVPILWEGAMPVPSWGASYLRECSADRNLYWSPGDARWATAFLDAKRAEGVETNSVQADPLMKAPGEPDFSLLADSPALSLGFEAFDLSDVGARGVRRGPKR